MIGGFCACFIISHDCRRCNKLPSLFRFVCSPRTSKFRSRLVMSLAQLIYYPKAEYIETVSILSLLAQVDVSTRPTKYSNSGHWEQSFATCHYRWASEHHLGWKNDYLWHSYHSRRSTKNGWWPCCCHIAWKILPHQRGLHYQVGHDSRT